MWITAWVPLEKCECGGCSCLPQQLGSDPDRVCVPLKPPAAPVLTTGSHKSSALGSKLPCGTTLWLAGWEDLWLFALGATVQAGALLCGYHSACRRKLLGRLSSTEVGAPELEPVWSYFPSGQVQWRSVALPLSVASQSWYLAPSCWGSGGTQWNGDVTHLCYQNKLPLILPYFKMWRAMNQSVTLKCKTALLVFDGGNHRLGLRGPSSHLLFGFTESFD